MVADLQTSSERSGSQQDRINGELADIERTINEKERALVKITPDWDRAKQQESAEKKRLDEANSRLAALFSKQGRVTKFRTKAERDSFLRTEISSLDSHKASQSAALTTMQNELANGRDALTQADAQMLTIQEQIESGRTRAIVIGEELAKTKEELATLTEKRKDAWREDTKSDSLVHRALEELQKAERTLGGMMDKVLRTGWSLSINSDRLHCVIGYRNGTQSH